MGYGESDMCGTHIAVASVIGLPVVALARTAGLAAVAISVAFTLAVPVLVAVAPVPISVAVAFPIAIRLTVPLPLSLTILPLLNFILWLHIYVHGRLVSWSVCDGENRGR